MNRSINYYMKNWMLIILSLQNIISLEDKQTMIIKNDRDYNINGEWNIGMKK